MPRSAARPRLTHSGRAGVSTTSYRCGVRTPPRRPGPVTSGATRRQGTGRVRSAECGDDTAPVVIPTGAVLALMVGGRVAAECADRAGDDIQRHSRNGGRDGPA